MFRLWRRRKSEKHFDRTISVPEMPDDFIPPSLVEWYETNKDDEDIAQLIRQELGSTGALSSQDKDFFTQRDDIESVDHLLEVLKESAENEKYEKDFHAEYYDPDTEEYLSTKDHYNSDAAGSSHSSELSPADWIAEFDAEDN